MVVSITWGLPSIDPNILQSSSWGRTQKGALVFGTLQMKPILQSAKFIDLGFRV